MIARIRFLCNEIDKVEPLKPKGQKMFEHGSTNLGWRLSEDAVVWSIAGRGMLQFSRKGLHRWSGRNRPAASSFPVVVDETAGKNSCVDKESGGFHAASRHPLSTPPSLLRRGGGRRRRRR
jgi:hypothetical protein